MGDIFEVQEILNTRTRNGKTEYKIRWKGFGPSDDTWEPEKNLLHCKETLDAYKKKMAEQSNSMRSTRTPAKTPVSSRVSVSSRSSTKRSSSRTSLEKTPALQRTRLRQRNTPKVQRVLGVKTLPASSQTKISYERQGNCSKCLTVGVVLCILCAVLLYVYLSMA